MSPDDETETTKVSGRPVDVLPARTFSHLRKMTERTGLWEHARFSEPRTEHGFCTDDNARALVVVCRESPDVAGLADLAATYLTFVLESRNEHGAFHNRRSDNGEWIDDVGSDDCQGRAWWGLGVMANAGETEGVREAAADAFSGAGVFSSDHLRANAYAALGAAEMLVASPDHTEATDLLRRASEVLASAAGERIPWPENRLTYDNPRIPEALVAAGTVLGDRRLTSIGLRLLEWLVGVETAGDHFSFTPVGGWEPGTPRPGFDQQPIEAWAMADACHRAFTVTGDNAWAHRATRSAQWFSGRNDTGMAMYDHSDGSTCDGLMEHSVNQNRGAESTLSGLGALQAAAACRSETDRA